MIIKKHYHNSIFLIMLICSILGQNVDITDPRLNSILNQSGLSLQEAQDIFDKNNDPSLDEDLNVLNQLNEKNIVQEVEDAILQDINVNDIITDSPKVIDKNFLSEEIISEIEENKTKKIEKILDDLNDKSNYFGYDVFQNDPEIFQESVFSSIDPGYLIGPGDEVIIMLWGDTEINQKYIVTTEGYLFIPNLGQVFVNALTLEKLEKTISIIKKLIPV